MDTTRAVHVVVFDGFADWEPAYALAELRRWGKRPVRALGFTLDPVVSMGGLRVSPDVSLDTVAATSIELLLLPGGDMWERPIEDHEILNSVITRLVTDGIPVAAICAGTLALARAGVLNSRRHTSNAITYLSTHASDYAGAAYYIDRPAVRDQHVITANGLSPVDFALEVFAELQVFSEADAALWYTMFKEGRPPRTPH